MVPRRVARINRVVSNRVLGVGDRARNVLAAAGCDLETRR
jgi:hypothetical protein